jgi:hypothetical protein
MLFQRRGVSKANQLLFSELVPHATWGLYRQNRSATFLARLIASAPAGKSGWFAAATRAAPPCAKAPARMTRATITVQRLPGKSRRCPQQDARICPPDDALPYLAPDLSATVHGGRIALAAIAREMGRAAEESRRRFLRYRFPRPLRAPSAGRCRFNHRAVGDA